MYYKATVIKKFHTDKGLGCINNWNRMEKLRDIAAFLCLHTIVHMKLAPKKEKELAQQTVAE